jgi:ankyrin repeat protein
MKKLILIGLLSLSMTFKVFAMAKGGSAPSSPSSLEKDLMAAAVAGNAELVNALIQKGANIDVQSKAGTTPLLAAVSQGHLEVVKTLLESDAKSDIRDNSGKTAFAIASQKYEDKKLDLHAQKKYESIKELLTKSERNGLLLEGIKANTEECNSCVEKILDLGADINVIDKQNHGHTALMIAILYRNRDMAKLLITRGADVNIQSFDKETALMRATDQKDTELVELLIGAKANVNDQDKSKQTALMLAIDKGNFPIAKSLMDARANVNAKTNFEQTPLMLAAKIINPKSAVEITRKLIKNKADIDTVDFNGVSALMHLASRGNYKTLALLLDAGAKTDTQDKNGISALFVAAKYGRTEAVKALLKAQADYLAFDHSNLGLLAYAELSKNPKVIDIIGCLPVDIICDRSKGPCFESLKNVEKRLLNPSKIWLQHAEGRKLTLATMVASHDIWCKGNPLRSRTWATLLHRASVREGFSLELSDLGVDASSKLSESEVVNSSNAKPKICYPK